MPRKLKPVLWTEERIREELRRMDRITGLRGAELPITFTRNHRCLGSFYVEERKFAFSLYWFDDPEWPEAEARDIIRHEYAHYMNLERNGLRNHGPEWEACCREVGATPCARYRSLEWRFRFYELNGTPDRENTGDHAPDEGGTK